MSYVKVSVDLRPVCLMHLFLRGETDWKVIAVDVTDPLANDLNGMHTAAVTQLHCYCNVI